jgi:hypothetical protein
VLEEFFLNSSSLKNKASVFAQDEFGIVMTCGFDVSVGIPRMLTRHPSDIHLGPIDCVKHLFPIKLLVFCWTQIYGNSLGLHYSVRIVLHLSVQES